MKSAAVVYLARSEDGSAKDFVKFTQSYRKFQAGYPHELIVIHKGAATKPGTRLAIALMLAGIAYKTIDIDDSGFDIQAYLTTSLKIDHEYVCFMNTYSEIRTDDWLLKLLQPLFTSPSVGITSATASYESLYDSIGMISKVIWLCSGKLIPYDPQIAAAFTSQLTAHAPEWMASAPALAGIYPSVNELLASAGIADGFARHWRAITRHGGGLGGLDHFNRFPNPHLRSNAFAMRRDVLNGMGFDVGNTKFDCVRFESGVDGLPTRIAELGLRSVLVGADGRAFETEQWPGANGFRLGNQSNVMVADNQVRSFETASEADRTQLAALSWGAYANFSPPLFSRLGFPMTKGRLALTHAKRDRYIVSDRLPKISIVIPTRSGPELVMDAVHTVINQGYENWECVVFDNNSDDPIAPHIAALNDRRVRCVRSNVTLPVTDSWNRAIDEGTGDYVTLFGDDDGLTPDFMPTIEFITRFHKGPDFIYSGLLQFFHPGVAPWEPSGYVIDLRSGFFFEGEGDIVTLDPASAQFAVTGSMEFKRNFTFNMQAFCFSKNFLDSIRKDGKVFHSPYPDYYLANVAMGLGKKITIAPKPLAIAGVSRKSFGFTLFNKLEEKGNAFLATDLSTDPLYHKIVNDILPGHSYNTSYFITMYHISERLGSFCETPVNVGRYRQLQILQALFREPDNDQLEPLAPEFHALLRDSELQLVKQVSDVARRAAAGDTDAIDELKRIRRDGGMSGRDPLVKQLDVGSFAHLPELFAAIREKRLAV
ncbi:MAG: glycosyltransferase family 2 protein [Acetobacteraceae bacterium]|nr:glycosyltransferase family 2 protein [Acetobacteraceae bacterium]